MNTKITVQQGFNQVADYLAQATTFVERAFHDLERNWLDHLMSHYADTGESIISPSDDTTAERLTSLSQVSTESSDFPTSLPVIVSYAASIQGNAIEGNHYVRRGQDVVRDSSGLYIAPDDYLVIVPAGMSFAYEDSTGAYLSVEQLPAPVTIRISPAGLVIRRTNVWKDVAVTS